MTLRPAPGPQLSAGRLRVDAAKAIAKLREYQLVYRPAWILEAIRAAVACGSKLIDLQGDSNDVWLSWAGEPWPADDLPRLFDELVSPEPGASRHHVRLLAAAVNSALGLNPAYVDVYSITDDGATRVRFTPEVLVIPEGDFEDSPLRKLQAHRTETPVGAVKGMHVHLRRRASLGVLSHWLRRADPPELVVAREACTDIVTPIRIGDSKFDRAVSTTDVVRVPLGEDVDGFVAITATRQDAATPFAIAERGVLLEQTTIDLGLDLDAPAPLRVLVDGPRMPTNASRSEVRRDAHPLPTAERRAKEVLPELIGKLVEKLSPVQLDPRARHAALQLLAAKIAGIDWAHRAREIEPPLRALAELPLVRDAAGVPRPITSSWSGLVHVGSDPIDAELSPWLSHVLWAPPEDPTSFFVTWSVDKQSLKEHVKAAKKERRAEKKFYKHAQREPEITSRRKPRVRARLGAPLANSCIPDAVFENFAGEICVYADREKRGGGELVVMLSGRDLETVRFDSSLAFAAAIDSTRIKPVDRYRGVMRDDEYTRLETAMRSGVVRAIEALVLAQSKTFVHEYQVAVEGSAEIDRRVIRDGLLLARNLRQPLTPIFRNAPIWRTTEGFLSIDELRRQPVLGLAPYHAATRRLEGRVIVFVDDTDRAILRDVVKAQLVEYEPSHLDDAIEPAELAMTVMGSAAHALAIRGADTIGAILPSAKPTLLVFHRGVLVASSTYTPTLEPCTIAVDCDKVIPAESWNAVLDDAGLAKRDYSDWEKALARAIASALVGRRTQELVGEAPIELSGALGRWLCWTLIAHDPIRVLGDDLLKEMRLCSLFRVLGEPNLLSIDELAHTFPQTINFVETPSEPVPGFPVLVAELLAARMIAKLANRRSNNAAEELAQKRQQLARDLRIGQHRMKPTQPLCVPYGGMTVKLESALGKGEVGVGRDVFEVVIFVEGRPFQTITRPGELPLVGVVELADLSQIDDKFEVVKPAVVEELCTQVQLRMAALVIALIESPELLVEPGPVRALFVKYLAIRTLAPEMRDVLAKSLRFPTIQGGQAPITEARSGPTILVSTWTGEWLAAEAGDPPSSFDRPVLFSGGSPEVVAIISAVGGIVDVTKDITKLQTQRRIARGLLPTPKVTAGYPEVTRRLADLGPAARHLGPGEIALVGGSAEVLVHAHGELRERVALDCLPAIQIAIEASDFVGNGHLIEARLGTQLRELALTLVREIVKKQAVQTLPAEIRRSLRAAILASRLADLRDAPVFETTSGTWIDLAAVQAQRELLGNLWSVPARVDDKPLDDRRIILVLDEAQCALANQHGIPVIDATVELSLDALARINRTRYAAESLALPRDVAQHVIAKVEIEGDGITGLRGTVGVLAPAGASRRGLLLHRGMHPFDKAPDPCRWPTIAIVDDVRFTPDRTWSLPERDAIYKEALDKIHRASNEALRAAVQPPGNALASLRIAPWTYDQVATLRLTDVQIRGTLWIAGPPLPDTSPYVHVIASTGERTFVPLRGPGLAGTIYVFAPNGWNTEPVLEELSKVVHAKLVKEIALVGRRDPDLVAAHVAWALALDRIQPDDAKHVRFTCFRPLPIDAKHLRDLLASKGDVAIVAPGSGYKEFAFVDDGTHTSRVIKTWLGTRARPPSQRTRPDTVEPPPLPPIPAPVVQHPLQPFVDVLHARVMGLGIAVNAWRIVDDRSDPIVQIDESIVEIAAMNRQLITIAADVAAKTAWSGDMLDALAAHCVTVLNVALEGITDATEANAIAKLLG